MENLNLNFAPFYVGQKVVCVSNNTSGTLEVGKQYTVLSVRQCARCKTWYVGWGVKNSTHFTCCTPEPASGYRMSLATRFAPIEERFISIEAVEVIKKEMPLVGAN